MMSLQQWNHLVISWEGRIEVKEMATRTYNGVFKREYLALCKLEKELYNEWRMNIRDIDAHNRLRGAMNVLDMCYGDKSRLDLVTPENNY